MTIIDLEEIVPKWFLMEGGGRVQLRTLSIAEFKDIQRKTVRKKVDYKKIEGTVGRFEYEELNQDLQNELYWDAVIVGWDNLTDKSGKEIPCTKENKVLLMTHSKKFLEFVIESLKALGEEEEARRDAEAKN